MPRHNYIDLTGRTFGRWVIPARGYVRDNVCVISHRANMIKRDGSIEEFEQIINYIRGQNASRS